MEKRRVMEDLFIETPVYTDIRTEDEVKSATTTLPHLMKFSTKFAILDKANGNKRIYHSEMYDKYFGTDEYKFRLGKGLINGQIRHPSGDPDPTKISHSFDRFWVKKDTNGTNYLWAEGRILDTLYGRVLYGLKKSGVELGISQRSICDSTINEDGMEEMGSSYYFMEGGDFVSVPAVSDAYPTFKEDSLKTVTDSLKTILPKDKLDEATHIIEELMEEKDGEGDSKKKKQPKFLTLVNKMIDENLNLQRKIEELQTSMTTRVVELNQKVKEKVDESILLKGIINSTPTIENELKQKLEEHKNKLIEFEKNISVLVSDSISWKVKYLEKVQELAIFQGKLNGVSDKLIQIEKKLENQRIELETKLKAQDVLYKKQLEEKNVELKTQLEEKDKMIAALQLDERKSRLLLELPISKREEAKRLFASQESTGDLDRVFDKLRREPNRTLGANEVDSSVSSTQPENLTKTLLRKNLGGK